MDTALHVIGACLLLLGMAAILAAWIVLVGDAFEEGALKGFLVLLGPTCTGGLGILYVLYYALVEYSSRYRYWILGGLGGGGTLVGMGGALMSWLG